MTNELKDALALANTIISDNPSDAPDNDWLLLARQLLRQREVVEKQEKALQEVDWNGRAELDLINANRDQILEMHEEAIRRVSAIIKPCKVEDAVHMLGAVDVLTVLKIIDALNTFHPMHSESWKGWPE